MHYRATARCQRSTAWQRYATSVPLFCRRHATKPVGASNPRHAWSFRRKSRVQPLCCATNSTSGSDAYALSWCVSPHLRARFRQTSICHSERHYQQGQGRERSLMGELVSPLAQQSHHLSAVVRPNITVARETGHCELFEQWRNVDVGDRRRCGRRHRHDLIGHFTNRIR